jgi:hypothetical protein
LFPSHRGLYYFLRCSKNSKRRSETSVETAENSENHEEVPKRRKKQAIFEDFKEIVPNVIGKLTYLCCMCLHFGA